MTVLTLELATRMIAAGFAHARTEGLRPMAMVVLDTGGAPIAFQREDGAAPGRYNLAHGKAYGTAMLQLPGRAQAALSERFPVLMGAANGVFGGAFVPVPGGVLVRDADGAVLGSVGVSGGMPEDDASVAIAGIEAVSLTAEA
ncbi:glcg protein [Acuticoccus sediminis]|uniref:Glcg protein n=1 Tax=Acuticoccus sediminis TaxID=2184697 RepID=A0A8B2NUF5_9HYPH|nr:heme-binding protein [Acuticoccus sediminis]RAH99969.1 glcg protein [Acuticoccus sediminis]